MTDPTSDQPISVRPDIDQLRRAAALMRARADAATPGPWLQEGVLYGRPSRNVRAQHQDGWPIQGVAYKIGRTADAEHIASWHPDVARAAADLLEETANDRARAARHGTRRVVSPHWRDVYQQLAATYLGEQPA